MQLRARAVDRVQRRERQAPPRVEVEAGERDEPLLHRREDVLAHRRLHAVAERLQVAAGTAVVVDETDTQAAAARLDLRPEAAVAGAAVDRSGELAAERGVALLVLQHLGHARVGHVTRADDPELVHDAPLGELAQRQEPARAAPDRDSRRARRSVCRRRGR